MLKNTTTDPSCLGYVGHGLGHWSWLAALVMAWGIGHGLGHWSWLGALVMAWGIGHGLGHAWQFGSLILTVIKIM